MPVDITNISIGSDDRNSVYLSVNKGIVATGSTQSQPNIAPVFMTSTPPTSSTTPSTAPLTNPPTHEIHPHFHIKKNSRIPRTHRLEALDAQRQDSVLHRCISLKYDFCKATR